MKVLGIIEGSQILEHRDGRVTWLAKMAIDNDGSDNRQKDPFFQPDTTLHFRGRPIDSEAVPGVVVPPLIVRGVRGIVMGCRAIVANTLTGQMCNAVVFDVGPKRKIGEGSPELARRLGVNPSAINGGEDRRVIQYTIFPGETATVDGVTYDLQPAFRPS